MINPSMRSLVYISAGIVILAYMGCNRDRSELSMVPIGVCVDRGVIQLGDSIQELETLFGRDQLISTSDINDYSYSNCAYRFLDDTVSVGGALCHRSATFVLHRNSLLLFFAEYIHNSDGVQGIDSVLLECLDSLVFDRYHYYNSGISVRSDGDWLCKVQAVAINGGRSSAKGVRIVLMSKSCESKCGIKISDYIE